MYYQQNDFDTLDAVLALAKARGVNPAQIALAWMLHKPGITSPIIGASKLHHLDDLAAALTIQLSDEEMAALEAPYRPHPVLGHD
jgi:aryl-alcohol dehydrogenase (NADP+)